MDTSPDDIVQILEKPLRAVRAALDHGVSFAETLAAEHAPNPHFYAHCIRMVARESLEKLQNDDWFLSGTSTNSSIQITQGLICFRVHMAQNGEPPHPGHSLARASFYEQETLQLNGGAAEPFSNLLLLYRITTQQGLVLELCKPMDAWRYGDPPILAWRRPVLFGTEDGEALRFQPAEGDIAIEPRRFADPDEVAEAG